MIKKLLTAVAFSAAFATSALAQQIKASDPDGMMEFFKSEGIAATKTIDDYGDPRIDIKYYKTSFEVIFYGCDNGANCTSITFFSGYQTEGSWSQFRSNVWNLERRYTRSYVTEEGSSRLEYDVYLGRDGMSARDFSDLFSTWTNELGEFEDGIDW
ncbi:MAG: YbjN domain-containing protein [Planktomarina sp.]